MLGEPFAVEAIGFVASFEIGGMTRYFARNATILT